MPLGSGSFLATSGLAIQLSGLIISSHWPSSHQPQALETRSHAASREASTTPVLTPVSQRLPLHQAEVMVTRYCPHRPLAPLYWWRGWEEPLLPSSSSPHGYHPHYRIMESRNQRIVLV